MEKSVSLTIIYCKIWKKLTVTYLTKLMASGVSGEDIRRKWDEMNKAINELSKGFKDNYK